MKKQNPTTACFSHALVLLLAVACFCPAAYAWDDHFRITRAAASVLKVTALEKPVTFVSLDKAVQFKFMSSLELAAWLKIRRTWDFPNRLGEKAGAKYAPIDIMAKYSDEPDWGVDQDLFRPHEYPELWNEDLKYITFKEGPKSQGFRHMHFPGKWLWWEPVSSIQVPQRPLGEAHHRAAIFFLLAREFFKAGEPYWGYRFLGWSLHFVQDLFQPFHSRQTPSKKFICFKRQWPFLDIPASGETIGYYHLGYEKWMNEVMKQDGNPLEKSLQALPAAATLATAPRNSEQELADFVSTEIVDYAASYATRVGGIAVSFFPPFDPRAGINVENLVHHTDWVHKLPASGHEVDRIRELTAEIFTKMGSVCRGWIASAIP